MNIVKLRIVSKGTAASTRVMLEGGQELPQVTAIRFAVDYDQQQVTETVIETILAEADLECEADVLVTTFPNGKRYRLEEIDDG